MLKKMTITVIVGVISVAENNTANAWVGTAAIYEADGIYLRMVGYGLGTSGNKSKAQKDALASCGSHFSGFGHCVTGDSILKNACAAVYMDNDKYYYVNISAGPLSNAERLASANCEDNTVSGGCAVEDHICDRAQ